MGIKEESFDEIFERGYTTKRDSKGIGLSLIKEAVDSLKGEIIINSVINDGTIFTVIIPKDLWKR